MFFHKQELQFTAKPDKPDAVYARRMQEILGGQYGEISVPMQYAFQGWNMHIPGKYRDSSSASPPRSSGTSRCSP
jgi:Mn-containing catalase